MNLVNVIRKPQGFLYNGNKGYIVRQLLTALRDNAYLAGGALRDIKRGEEPRDYDIVCRNNVDCDDIFRLISRHIGRDNIVCNKKHKDNYGDDRREVMMVSEVWKCTVFGTHQVDIIMYPDNINSMESVLTRFDFSVNAIVANREKVIDWSPMDGDQVRIINTDNLSWQRFDRFKAMFPDLRWDAAEEEMIRVIGVRNKVMPLKKIFNQKWDGGMAKAVEWVEFNRKQKFGRF